MTWLLRMQVLGALLGLLLAQMPPAAGQPSLRRDEWQLEWAEEFNAGRDSSALQTRWRFAYPWGRNLLGNAESQFYTGEALQLDSGKLNLVATRLAQPKRYLGRKLTYTSGMVFSRRPGPDSLQPATCMGPEGFSYGLFEIRCRQPRDPTAFPAFWLFGTPDEVDIFEANNAGFSSTVHVYQSRYWRPEQPDIKHCGCFYYDTDKQRDLSQQFHTYSLAWRPDELVFYFDGYPIRRETRYTPLGCPMAVIANLAMLSWATPATDTLAIDYIRVYRPKHPYPAQPLAEPGGPRPRPDNLRQPAATDPGRPDPTWRQQWQAQPDSAGRLRLQLVENLNQECGTWMALPAAARPQWSPPLMLQAGLPALSIQFSGALPTEWILYNQLGDEVLNGAVAAGAAWRPSWPSLPPGAYRLWLRQGPAEAVHPVIELGRPVRSAPSPAWLTPAPVAD